MKTDLQRIILDFKVSPAQTAFEYCQKNKTTTELFVFWQVLRAIIVRTAKKESIWFYLYYILNYSQRGHKRSLINLDYLAWPKSGTKNAFYLGSLRGQRRLNSVNETASRCTKWKLVIERVLLGQLVSFTPMHWGCRTYPEEWEQESQSCQDNAVEPVTPSSWWQGRTANIDDNTASIMTVTTETVTAMAHTVLEHKLENYNSQF